MELMQVAVAIAKPGQSVGALILGKILRVALETESKVLLGIGEVKFFRKRIFQNLAERRTVG